MQDQANRHIVTNGPIRLLQPELLRLIFLENTARSPDWPFHDRLLTARSSSQVCQQWREIVLTSSVLWGRLIVLDQLHFTKVDDAWRNEVLARAGSALLWIQGHVSVADYKIFLYFLEQKWERVERVDITADRDIPHYARSVNEVWKGLESKAPNLKSFKLDYVGRTSPFSNPNTHTTHFLFKDGAPKLREISVPDMKFDTFSPWLCNMRSITLSAVFSIQDMFIILKATPLLTNLDITIRPVERYLSHPVLPLKQSQQCITLPFLDTFTLRTYFHVALPFLEFLEFPTACILDIFLSEQGQWGAAIMYNGETTSTIQNVIMERMKQHLSVRKLEMTYLTIDIATWETKFFFAGHGGIQRLAGLHMDNQINTPSHILEELSICDYLPPVKEMRITVDVLLSPASYFLARFPSCSLSLTTLVTDELTLKFFLNIKSIRQESVPFPALKVLKLTHFLTEDPERYTSQVIRHFFQWQSTGSSPISVLDLSNIPFHDLPNLEYLDKATGLKTVKWISPSTGSSEYECGSGKPTHGRGLQGR